MIYLSVDEAYAFDYLSILQLKTELATGCEKNWQDCYKLLNSQLKEELWIEIINSSEYDLLKSANKDTFYAIEKIRNGEEVSAKDLDKLNTIRYERKKQLQNKFFNKDLLEFKT